ncbi:hypothetical protein [Tellurirhabdus bombi]|uniref:hypothetical protein n=1 Tax=Tellurirhabdus bombi TaxID=2907205 RepID=UPI001F36C3E0|nr:hypothetical protein [Tellurirhabdus bombi]
MPNMNSIEDVLNAFYDLRLHDYPLPELEAAHTTVAQQYQFLHDNFALKTDEITNMMSSLLTCLEHLNRLIALHKPDPA